MGQNADMRPKEKMRSNQRNAIVTFVFDYRIDKDTQARAAKKKATKKAN